MSLCLLLSCLYSEDQGADGVAHRWRLHDLRPCWSFWNTHLVQPELKSETEYVRASFDYNSLGTGDNKLSKWCSCWLWLERLADDPVGWL
jgi:hypothetical protein